MYKQVFQQQHPLGWHVLYGTNVQTDRKQYRQLSMHYTARTQKLMDRQQLTTQIGIYHQHEHTNHFMLLIWH